MQITYQIARSVDLQDIRQFVDYWLSGRARGPDRQISSNDYFVSHRQHSDYLKEKTVLMAHNADILVGWAVMSKTGTLIHLLIHGHYRNQGIASRMIQILNPKTIRSKADQGTGDPGPWYERRGFIKTSTEPVGKNKNIDIYENASPP